MTHHKAKRLLMVEIMDPSPSSQNDAWGEYSPFAYEVLIEFFLTQIKGLQDFDLRFILPDQDAFDAIRFWILPLMGENYDMLDSHHYLLKDWGDKEVLIEFSSSSQLSKQDQENFQTICRGKPLCPMLSSRLIHAALAQSKPDHIIGKTAKGNIYFEAIKTPFRKKHCYQLPPFEVIDSALAFKKCLTEVYQTKIKKIMEHHSSSPSLELP